VIDERWRVEEWWDDIIREMLKYTEINLPH
jgi:hypothetical protein